MEKMIMIEDESDDMLGSWTRRSYKNICIYMDVWAFCLTKMLLQILSVKII